MGWPYQQKPPMGWPLDYDSGLVPDAGFWPMLEDSGNKVSDLSGNAIDLSMTSHGIWTVTPLGPGLTTSLTTQDIASGNYGSKLAFSNIDDFTIIFLGRVDAQYTPFEIEAHASISSINTYFFFYNQPGVERVYFYTGGSSVVYTRIDGGDGDFAHKLIHCAGTYEGTTKTRKLYIDGVLRQTSSSDPGVTTDTGNVIFRANINNSYTAVGFVYNRVLSASEIASLHREPFCMFKNPVEIALLGGYQAEVGMAGAMTTNTGYWGW